MVCGSHGKKLQKIFDTCTNNEVQKSMLYLWLPYLSRVLGSRSWHGSEREPRNAIRFFGPYLRSSADDKR